MKNKYRIPGYIKKDIDNEFLRYFKEIFKDIDDIINTISTSAWHNMFIQYAINLTNIIFNNIISFWSIMSLIYLIVK